MTDFDPPADLIELKAAWFAAMEASRSVGNEENAGDPTGAYRIPSVHTPAAAELWALRFPTEQQLALRQAARDKVDRINKALYDHKWWDAIPGGQRDAADIAVRRAAQALHDAEHAASV